MFPSRTHSGSCSTRTSGCRAASSLPNFQCAVALRPFSSPASASIDLALAWVEEDCGAGLAHETARELVLFLRRPGGQPQVSVSLGSQASEMLSLRELQIWIAEHLESRLRSRISPIECR